LTPPSRERYGSSSEFSRRAVQIMFVIHFLHDAENLATLAVLAFFVYGKPNDSASDRHSVSEKQSPPPATAYTYDSNCCTSQAAQKADEKPHRWYTPFERPDWWILIVAAATGGMVGWQAWETRKSAEATERSIALQTQSLRPRLSVSNFTKDVFAEALAGGWTIVNLKIENSGGMPAYGMVAETWIEFIEGVPPHTFSSNARYREAAPINVHTGKPQGFYIPLGRKLTSTEIHQMANAEAAICFRIRMRYSAFGEDVHTDEAFMARPGEMESIAEYTSAT